MGQHDGQLGLLLFAVVASSCRAFSSWVHQGQLEQLEVYLPTLFEVIRFQISIILLPASP